MILNGKCKEDFFKWNEGKSYVLSNDLIAPALVNALIIEFFDSVGIYINISVTYGFNWNIDNYGGEDYNSRFEATEQAIIKANNIYNGK